MRWCSAGVSERQHLSSDCGRRQLLHRRRCQQPHAHRTSGVLSGIVLHPRHHSAVSSGQVRQHAGALRHHVLGLVSAGALLPTRHCEPDPVSHASVCGGCSVGVCAMLGQSVRAVAMRGLAELLFPGKLICQLCYVIETLLTTRRYFYDCAVRTTCAPYSAYHYRASRNVPPKCWRL